MSYPDISYTSPEWGKIRDWLQEEYTYVAKEICGAGVEERRADFLRGKAAFISMLLDLPDNAA